MGYYLTRAMEVIRLSDDRLWQLQEREKIKGRCRMPFEIQSMFNLPSLRETWRIPSDATKQDRHKMDLKDKFRNLGLIPEGGDLSATDVQSVHEFDEKVRAEKDLDLVCHLGETVKKNYKDRFSEDEEQVPF